MTTPKMIVCEGPKAAGKSETCKLIVEFLNNNGMQSVYHKHLRSEVDEFQNMVDLIMYANSRQSKEIVVVDRFVWSEYVMSIYLRRVDPVYLYHRCHAIENLMQEYKIPQLLLLPGTVTLENRLAERIGDRRNLDMPIGVIHPLWRSALAVSRMVLNTNIDEFDRKQIMDFVAKKFGIKI